MSEGNGEKPKQKPNETPKKCVSPLSGHELVPGNPGNSGGKKGRSGRRPSAFKQFCRELLAEDETQDAIASAAQAPFQPGFSSTIRTLAEYAEGAPEETHHHYHHEAKTRLLDELARVADRRGAGPDRQQVQRP